jgi:type II secretion system protein G
MRIKGQARRGGGFTLIELLIVVAIIAILAAIAVPNFLEAQTRSKVARVKADMRTLATALESYTVDNTRHPIGMNEGNENNLGLWLIVDRIQAYAQITTPIAYLTSIPPDPFYGKRGAFNYNTQTRSTHEDAFQYQTNQGLPPLSKTSNQWKGVTANGYTWQLFSQGPRMYGGAPWVFTMLCYPHTGGVLPTNIYDPTNGTISQGYIVRTNKGIYTGQN